MHKLSLAAFLPLLPLLPALASACAPAARSAVDLTMGSAYRPRAAGPARAAPAEERGAPAEAAPRYELLAGDLHCHVMPPDAPGDVSRGVAETVALARAEGLDFVVLTPHVAARFFQRPELRREVLDGREALRKELAKERSSDTLFVLGMEYTDHRYGHVGASFADLEQVLRDVPVAESIQHPERFFERFVARGGLLVVNHPLITPLDSVFAMARANLSWRPFTARGPFPAEIRAADRLAQGFEAYNLTATHLRDRFLLGDTEHSIVETLGRLDQEIIAQGRRMIPVGGSDSHAHHMRATTFVLSERRTEAGVRDAIAAGRVCVRSQEACSLEVRSAGPLPVGPWVTVGGAVTGSAIEARARGEDIDILVNGVSAGHPASSTAIRIALPEGRCAVIRARVGVGYSAPIYANCGFAAPAAE